MLVLSAERATVHVRKNIIGSSLVTNLKPPRPDPDSPNFLRAYRCMAQCCKGWKYRHEISSSQ
jgi:hypothetical protein